MPFSVYRDVCPLEKQEKNEKKSISGMYVNKYDGWITVIAIDMALVTFNLKMMMMMILRRCNINWCSRRNMILNTSKMRENLTRAIFFICHSQLLNKVYKLFERFNSATNPHPPHPLTLKTCKWFETRIYIMKSKYKLNFFKFCCDCWKKHSISFLLLI